MSFKLRDYQVKALNIIDKDLKEMPEVLIQGITGSGKTTIFSRLINKYYTTTDKTFLVLVHKQEVVQQIYDTIRERTDVHFKDLGICCASLKARKTDRRVTVASIQTFVNMTDNYNYADLIIIDEVHRVDINKNSQYKQVFDFLRLQRPDCRILGFTSTPARLDHGYIYGDRCKNGSENLFPILNHTIKYAELMDAGYLVPLKGMVAKHSSLEADLAGVSVNGDYVIDQLGEIMVQERHLDTAVEAIEEYCSEYKKICVFCCTIDHAEQLNDLLGDEATTVHSKLNRFDRDFNMQAWKSGQKRIITSVGILTEGFDFPELDCLVFARPTLSSTLWLQAVGRVLRIFPGKDHGFLVDLTDNTSRFSTDLDRVKITLPKTVQAAEDKEKEIWKICPNCEVEVHVSLRECLDCGFVWEAAECVIAKFLPEMEAVEFGHILPAEPELYEVMDWTIDIHTSKKNGKLLGKITYRFQETEYKNSQVFLWLCFPDYYQGFAVQKAQKTWATISNDTFPLTCDEFLEKNFNEPSHISVDMNGRYPDLKEILCHEVEMSFADSDDDFDDIPF